MEKPARRLPEFLPQVPRLLLALRLCLYDAGPRGQAWSYVLHMVVLCPSSPSQDELPGPARPAGGPDPWPSHIPWALASTPGAGKEGRRPDMLGRFKPFPDCSRQRAVLGKEAFAPCLHSGVRSNQSGDQCGCWPGAAWRPEGPCPQQANMLQSRPAARRCQEAREDPLPIPPWEDGSPGGSPRRPSGALISDPGLQNYKKYISVVYEPPSCDSCDILLSQPKRGRQEADRCSHECSCIFQVKVYEIFGMRINPYSR